MTAALRLPDASLSPQAQYHDNTGRNRPDRASAPLPRQRPRRVLWGTRARDFLYNMQKIRNFVNLLQ